MEKQIYIDDNKTNFWIEDTGRLRNQKTKKWLKGGYNKGYHFYSLYFRGKQYLFYTHRLVAQYFVSNPKNLSIVHHIDGNKTNNLYTNLAWVSTKEHGQTIIEQRKSEEKETRIRQRIDKDFILDNAKQFRNSPYYISRKGHVYNISKCIELRLEESGEYLRFSGRYNLNGKHFLVHRAVWETYNGKIPTGYDIDHLDGNPKNNNLDNLELITHKENLKRRKMDYSYAVNNFYREENKKRS